jgi:hypothetical protein
VIPALLEISVVFALKSMSPAQIDDPGRGKGDPGLKIGRTDVGEELDAGMSGMSSLVDANSKSFISVHFCGDDGYRIPFDDMTKEGRDAFVNEG